MPKKIVIARLCIFWAGFWLAGGALAQSVAVIELNYRPAAELLPVLQPLTGRDGSIQAHQDKLILRVSPAALADIRRVVAELDTPPRQLLVSVKQQSDSSRQHDSATLSGRAGGSSGGVVVNGPRREDGVVVYRDGQGNVLRGGVSSRSRDLGGRATQQLRILEGRAGLIQVGTQTPVVQRQVLPSSLGAPVVIEQPAYVDASTGFEVRPRVVGNQFEMEISPQQTLRDGREFQVQRVNTTVSGPLGQWVDIGGAISGQSSHSSGLSHYQTGSTRRDSSVLVKVELLP